MNNNDKKSLLGQTFATLGLMQQLDRIDFLHSRCFQALPFTGLGTDGETLKKILLESGIGNPAMMLMFLYALLVMPKELFSVNPIIEAQLKSETNVYLSECAEIIESTYLSDSDQFNYYRHLRNSVAHAKFTFQLRENCSYVIFCDEKKEEKCSFKVETLNIGILLSKLQNKLIELYNEISNR